MKKKQSIRLGVILLACFSLYSFVFINSRSIATGCIVPVANSIVEEANADSPDESVEKRHVIPDLSIVEKLFHLGKRVLPNN